jgi:hypothetical protein
VVLWPHDAREDAEGAAAREGAETEQATQQLDSTALCVHFFACRRVLWGTARRQAPPLRPVGGWGAVGARMHEGGGRGEHVRLWPCLCCGWRVLPAPRSSMVPLCGLILCGWILCLPGCAQWKHAGPFPWPFGLHSALRAAIGLPHLGH